MPSLFERVHVEANSVKPAAIILTLIAVPFVVVGWTVGAVVRGAVFLLGWAVAAAKVGYKQARKRSA